MCYYQSLGNGDASHAGPVRCITEPRLDIVEVSLRVQSIKAWNIGYVLAGGRVILRAVIEVEVSAGTTGYELRLTVSK